jgi:hypothetical protein
VLAVIEHAHRRIRILGATPDLTCSDDFSSGTSFGTHSVGDALVWSVVVVEVFVFAKCLE